MGSLLITPFSCTLKPTLKINMKVFATLTTVLGASAAAPLNQLHSSNNMKMNQHSVKPSIGMSMESQMPHHGMSDRRMDMAHQRSNMRDMYMNNQHMMGQELGPYMMDQEMSHRIMGQEMKSNMRDMHRQNQVVNPNQYFKEDDMGNYVYAYDDQFTEKKEEGNHLGDVQGHYAYTMPNGIQRQVNYVADNNGFHVRDNADPARIKRSSEPDHVQTKMTSVMDSSSLRDDARDMHGMSNMMGRDMSSQVDRSMMGMDQQRYSNMMMGRNMIGQDSMGRQMMNRNMMGQDSTDRQMMNGNVMMGRDNMGQRMMGQNTMGRNMMGRNIYNIMSNRGMTSDMSNMMGQQMDSNMMGRDMTMDVMGRNMMGQDRSSQMMRRNMMGQNMTPNMMYSNMMGQDMMDMANSQKSSKMMNSNNGLMGQHMMQQMQMERVPETYTSTRFF